VESQGLLLFQHRDLSGSILNWDGPFVEFKLTELTVAPSNLVTVKQLGGAINSRTLNGVRHDVIFAWTDIELTVADAVTIAWALPLLRLTVNEAEDMEEPFRIDSEVGVSEVPPDLESVTVIAPDVLITAFWNWSIKVTLAVMDRPLPLADSGEIVQAKDVEPTVPVQVTVAAPLCVDTLLKLTPDAAPALTLKVVEVPAIEFVVSVAVSTTPVAALTSVIVLGGTVAWPVELNVREVEVGVALVPLGEVAIAVPLKVIVWLPVYGLAL
jgi:hypothetical protein